METRAGRPQFGGGGKRLYRLCILSIISLFIFVSFVQADLGPENLLILVNADSSTSQYITNMYRDYYPAITDVQVLQLSGLPDCSGSSSTAADEIITRDQYDTLIAVPVRQHLLNNDLIQQIMVIVTTAGMPYRIEDTTYADVIYPAGSNYNLVSQNTGQINAASVESELTCLWYADEFGLENRMVNPYQGYRNSSVTLFDRQAPGSKPMIWSIAITLIGVPPKMEGFMDYSSWPPNYGTINRSMSPGDIYLTCRLDGPKDQGQSAVFAVREMLERSRLVSDLASGLNPQKAVAVIDDAPSEHLDGNRVYNLDGSMNYYSYNSNTPQPPDAPSVLSLDDYLTAYEFMTNQDTYENDQINIGYMDVAYSLKVVMDRRAGQRSCQNDLGTDEVPVFFCCFGRNGDEPGTGDYLTNGLNGGPLFNPSNGAVFTSIESFNALTMFADIETAPVAQGKIIDFITIGGTGAIGHAFEPMSSAVVDNAYLAYNLFADSDMDNRADLTFVESAWTGIPFLSWAEVVIGDPLMRIVYGPGEAAAWEPIPGDADNDGRINIRDLILVRDHMGGSILPGATEAEIQNYDDRCDLNQDGRINISDFILSRNLL